MALKKIPGVASAVFSTIAAVLWMEWLKASDAYYIPYLVTAGVSLYCVGRNHLLPPCLTVWQKFCLLLGSSAFSLAVVLANYAYLASAGQTALYFLCGVCIGWQIFSCLLTCCERPSRLVRPERPRRKGWQVWLLFAAGISAVYLFVFFTCKYPGIFTYDTAQQLAQIQSGVYSNHHPFYHTQIIRLFLTVGMALFGEGNQAAALYCVFQVLTIAAVFSYVLTTLYQQKINRGGYCWYWPGTPLCPSMCCLASLSGRMSCGAAASLCLSRPCTGYSSGWAGISG